MFKVMSSVEWGRSPYTVVHMGHTDAVGPVDSVWEV